jgi:hypothetical protein
MWVVLICFVENTAKSQYTVVLQSKPGFSFSPFLTAPLPRLCVRAASANWSISFGGVEFCFLPKANLNSDFALAFHNQTFNEEFL